jgi:hypothetical protein
VFLVLLSVYLLTFQETFRVDDEHILAARAQSLALWGRLEQPQAFGNQRERELQAMGAAATQIEPGQAVLGAGLYRAAMALGWGGAQTLFLQNAILTAATGAILALSVGTMGFSASVGVAVALLFGLGTFAWPYATTYLRDPLAMFGTALAFYGWVWSTRTGQNPHGAGWLVLVAGVFIGVAAKNATLVLVPAFGLMIPAGATHASPRSRKRWVYCVAGTALVGMLLLLLPKPAPLARFSAGYYLSVAGHFLGSLDPATVAAGMLGTFVSPARSLFLFCPPLFLLLAVPRRWWRGQTAVAGAVLLAVIGLALAQVLFYRQNWAGAVGWGPRAMLAVLPGLMLLTAPGIARLRAAAAGRWALVGVAAVSAVVQLSAVLVPWQTAYESIRALGLDPFTYAGAWDIRRLLPAHQIAALPRLAAWSTAWIRLARLGTTAWIIPVGLCGMGSLAGWLLLHMSRHRTWLAASVAMSLSLAVIWGAGSTLRPDPVWYAGVGEIGQALELAEAEVQAGDVILIDAYTTPAWFRMMNEWPLAVRWYSLPFEIPGTEAASADAPQPDTIRLLDDLLSDDGRIWLIASSAAPDYLEGDERAWLAEHGRLESARSFEGATRVDVLVFTPIRP